MYFLLRMVIFRCYVSLPEGAYFDLIPFISARHTIDVYQTSILFFETKIPFTSVYNLETCEKKSRLSGDSWMGNPYISPI